MAARKALSIGASNTVRVIVENMNDIDADSLRSAAEYLMDSVQDLAAVVLGSCPGGLVAAFSPGVVGLGLQAGKFVGPIAKSCGGGGGGRPNFAQAGRRKPQNLSNALEKGSGRFITYFVVLHALVHIHTSEAKYVKPYTQLRVSLVTVIS
ncbi:Alanine--trna ligase [Thalictrum thalictroides]|uniref:Alanine--tRNA ligase n=1 Tax=Thalictrum thalictroides TaxID=46969 RepID=A0A7J6VZ29_THATH|nr:Alanine--trna ligase [Thalictrum thalictroides]